MSAGKISADVALVTGGAGYIGSHACVSLVQAGYQPLIVDNLSNSSRGVLPRLSDLCGQPVSFLEGDIRDFDWLRQVLREHRPRAVLHFAGLKSVGESVEFPDLYHENNVVGSQTLVDAMQDTGIKHLVFSSSATVYGAAEQVPVSESAPLSAVNPYGQTKLDVERLLAKRFAEDPQWSIACLRYFNPVGAHPSGQIGENPKGIPNNLMPYITQVAVGRREYLNVYGNDYPTPDGTGVRDYIHVMDLVEGHIAALKLLGQAPGLHHINLGTGKGVSVLEMIKAFEKASGRTIPYRIVNRRPGDSAEIWADPALAEHSMGWKAHRNLQDMCADSWRWQQQNPEGYNEG